MPVDRVLLAQPRGFCAGVEMAIKALAWMVRVYDPPVYCFHEIVHNRVVVDRFRDLGVVFVNDVAEVPEGAPLMLSAHGTAPGVVAAARARGGVVVDAVCPLVTKVHHEVKVRAGQGYTVMYVGHEGHDEAVGTMAVAPDAVVLVEREEDVEKLDLPSETPVALLAQTTLAMQDWAGVMERAQDRFPALWMPGKSDLCFATTNRQTALRAIADKAGTVIVIGSENSSNTRALEKTAAAAGCRAVLRINDAAEIPPDISGIVGVTAGASAPEELIAAVIERLAPVHGVEVVEVTTEEEYFPPPRELRTLLAESGRGGALQDDRSISASEVLASLRRP